MPGRSHWTLSLFPSPHISLLPHPVRTGRGTCLPRNTKMSRPIQIMFMLRSQIIPAMKWYMWHPRPGILPEEKKHGSLQPPSGFLELFKSRGSLCWCVSLHHAMFEWVSRRPFDIIICQGYINNDTGTRASTAPPCVSTIPHTHPVNIKLRLAICCQVQHCHRVTGIQFSMKTSKLLI